MRGQWKVATLYRAHHGTRSVEKGYWSRQTAESHYNNMRGKPGVVAMVLYNPTGGIVRSWNAERDQ